MSNSMNNFDDFLRQQLQQSHDYIDDGDFTAGLMARLPAPKRLNPWLEKLIIALPVTLIALWVCSQFPWRELVQPVYAWLLLVDMGSLLGIALAVLALLFIVPASLLLRRSY